mmetsp:Transcript_18876/g.30857  ORF Transcript_18876/g.30857 Transcript_18876/m.30857 type:complete len:136 (+) Transcript_18876:35-442(+)|eukprot:CAMPEP_0203789662 /NCGR_PEP_ID=MMETSP0100_2-20121128/3584_1 /ASSEMBLY_ACC=CAM_ASM_000210 /TAXON_ID=96639 /ORGANISM=" , Strain NY0313808BC1" /LENGTH=135 /DNA_ID=CAMNT_0050692655 /DNA_START=20 /DNA_END=427 /DNA_ORIENTATION=-
MRMAARLFAPRGLHGSRALSGGPGAVVEKKAHNYHLGYIAWASVSLFLGFQLVNEKRAVASAQTTVQEANDRTAIEIDEVGSQVRKVLEDPMWLEDTFKALGISKFTVAQATTLKTRLNTGIDNALLQVKAAQNE